jgi:hypothetical protein
MNVQKFSNSNCGQHSVTSYIDDCNVKGLKGQIMTFQESRKTKIIKKLYITFFIFKQSIWLKYHLFYFFKWNLMLPFNLFHIEQAVFKAIKTELILPKIQKWPIFNHEYLANY